MKVETERYTLISTIDGNPERVEFTVEQFQKLKPTDVTALKKEVRQRTKDYDIKMAECSKSGICIDSHGFAFDDKGKFVPYIEPDRLPTVHEVMAYYDLYAKFYPVFTTGGRLYANLKGRRCYYTADGQIVFEDENPAEFLQGL